MLAQCVFLRDHRHKSRLCDHADTNVSLRITHTLTDTGQTRMPTDADVVCVCVCPNVCLLFTCVSVLPTQYVSFAMVRSPHVLSYSEIFPHERRQKGAPKTSNITLIEIRTHLTASGDSLSAVINR